MTIVKSIETPEKKIWIEQHNEYFILKSQEKNKPVEALNATPNLTMVLEFFDKLHGGNLSN